MIGPLAGNNLPARAAITSVETIAPPPPDAEGGARLSLQEGLAADDGKAKLWSADTEPGMT
jgi:hypothetical protein